MRYTYPYNINKPYGYDTLGWYSNIQYAKMTKEWQTYATLISSHGIDGDIRENEIKLYGPYDCHFMPNLFIEEYRILK